MDVLHRGTKYAVYEDVPPGSPPGTLPELKGIADFPKKSVHNLKADGTPVLDGEEPFYAHFDTKESRPFGSLSLAV